MADSAADELGRRKLERTGRKSSPATTESTQRATLENDEFCVPRAFLSLGFRLNSVVGQIRARLLFALERQTKSQVHKAPAQHCAQS